MEDCGVPSEVEIWKEEFGCIKFGLTIVSKSYLRPVLLEAFIKFLESKALVPFVNAYVRTTVACALKILMSCIRRFFIMYLNFMAGIEYSLKVLIVIYLFQLCFLKFLTL